MKKLSVVLILCMIISSFSYTTFAAFDNIAGSISTSSLTSVYPGDEITLSISVDKEQYTELTAFDIVGSLTNLTVKSFEYLPSNKPSQLISTRTTGKNIDFTAVYVNNVDIPALPSGNRFMIAEIKVTADAAGTASVEIDDSFARFSFGEEDSFKRNVRFSDISFTVLSQTSGGNSGGNSGGSSGGSSSGSSGGGVSFGGGTTVTPPIVVAPVWKNPFTDVKETDWYYASVEFANKNNLMKGLTEDTFSPNTSVTRAMFVTVLYRMEGEPLADKCTFSDVPSGSYYEKAVAWASANGIVNGVSEENFAPDNNITREQMAAIVYRYASYKKADLSVGENTNILSYNDFSDISEYAIPAFQYMAGEGIMKGETETTLNPKNLSTRAQTATVFMRFMEKLSK